MDILDVAEKVGSIGFLGSIGKAIWDRYTKKEDKREERKDSLDDTLRSTAKQLVEEMTSDLRSEVRELRGDLKESQRREIECQRMNAQLEARILVLEQVNGLTPPR